MAEFQGPRQHGATRPGLTPTLTFGFRETAGAVRNLFAAYDEVVEELKRVNERSAARLESRTRQLAPHDTGRMKRLLKTRFSPTKLTFETGWEAEDFYAEGQRFYPPYQEDGTIHHPPHPSLGPAYDEEHPQYLAEVSAAVRRGLELRRARSSSNG